VIYPIPVCGRRNATIAIFCPRRFQWPLHFWLSLKRSGTAVKTLVHKRRFRTRVLRCESNSPTTPWKCFSAIFDQQGYSGIGKSVASLTCNIIQLHPTSWLKTSSPAMHILKRAWEYSKVEDSASVTDSSGAFRHGDDVWHSWMTVSKSNYCGKQHCITIGNGWELNQIDRISLYDWMFAHKIVKILRIWMDAVTT